MMRHILQQNLTPPTNPATAWCRACRNVVIEQNLWQFTTALPPTSQAMTNPTGVHSTGAFSCRLYSSLLGVNLFCTGVISLPGQLLLAGCCQGSPFKIKISLAHLAILACCCLLLFRSHCEGFNGPVPRRHGHAPLLLYCIPTLPRCLLSQTIFPPKNHTVKTLIIL